VRLFSWVLVVFLMVSVNGWSAEPIAIGPLDRIMGQADAPLTVIEYASMTCPHCAHFHEDVMPAIKAEWVDTGKIRFIYRDLPTAPVGMAVGVAMIAQCAPKDQYFGILGLLFRSQSKWMGAPEPLAEIKHTVSFAGISADAVDSCLQNKELGQAIQDRASEGTRLFGIESTPTLVINGVRIEGQQGYGEIKKALEAAYARVAKK
jgi:protein-disulfide isomerase